MAEVGDRVEVLPSKGGQLPRTGVVTGLSGSLIAVRWDSGEETRFIPGPGVMRVVQGAQRRATSASRSAASPAKADKKPKKKKQQRKGKK